MVYPHSINIQRQMDPGDDSSLAETLSYLCPQLFKTIPDTSFGSCDTTLAHPTDPLFSLTDELYMDDQFMKEMSFECGSSSSITPPNGQSTLDIFKPMQEATTLEPPSVFLQPSHVFGDTDCSYVEEQYGQPEDIETLLEIEGFITESTVAETTNMKPLETVPSISAQKLMGSTKINTLQSQNQPAKPPVFSPPLSEETTAKKCRTGPAARMNLEDLTALFGISKLEAYEREKTMTRIMKEVGFGVGQERWGDLDAARKDAILKSMTSKTLEVYPDLTPHIVYCCAKRIAYARRQDNLRKERRHEKSAQRKAAKEILKAKK